MTTILVGKLDYAIFGMFKWLTLFVFMHNSIIKSRSKFDNMIRWMHLIAYPKLSFYTRLGNTRVVPIPNNYVISFHTLLIIF